MTRTIALIGHPVAHSLSPRFQQAALDALGIDARYEAWDVPAPDLPIAIERLRSGSVIGANVTVPHKVAMLGRVDHHDALAERVGAVNTVVRRDGQLHATNTDVAGVLRALADAGATVRGARVVLLGAGGAARAVVVALRDGGAAHLTVANRTLERARGLVPLGGDAIAVEVAPLDPADAALRRAMREASIVIQSTSLGLPHTATAGLSPVPRALFARGQVAFDLVYGREPTPFLRYAEAAGAQPVDGLAMLVHQGAASFRIWTGAEAPLDVMFGAARGALSA
ncbi:MAG: shikimate dehydrogenase [Chloroflexi bacterium]|nr:shikimate dehydrogenase [Chloroflexota bacterium]